MNTIEVRLNRRLLIAFTGLVIMVMIGTTIYIFTADKYADSYSMKLLYVGLNAYLIFSLYKIGKKLRNNNAAITISKDALSFYDQGLHHTYNWIDVRDVSISNEDNTWYLTLRTIYEEKKFSITWLDKSPQKIKELIDEYRRSIAAKRDLTP